MIDIGIGRLPVTSNEEAQDVVDKIIRYGSPEAMGDWRNIICFIGDDEDNNIPQLEDLDQEGRILTFYLEIEGEWSLIGQSRTDSSGWFNLTTSFLLPYGVYPFKVVFYGDDYYQFDERKHRLVGYRTKKLFQLGDGVMVRVAHVDLQKMHIDFTLVTKLS